MAITSGDLNKLDTAMRQYFNAVYRASHAAYKDGFDLSARRAAVSDATLNTLRDRVTAAADPINQTVFTFDSYAARQVEKLAREAATKDTRAGVDREVGLGKAAATFKSNGSLSIIAELDDSNAGARGVPGQTSHASLIKEARSGNMLAQNYDTPGAKKSTGGGIIPSAHAAEPAAKKSHADLALDYVLKGQSADVRKEVVRIMGAAEGRTTPEKLAYLSAALREGGDQTDPVLASNITRAIGALNLKNQMDITGTTQWKNTNSEAYFNRALANADALREKQENGQDISVKGSPKRGRYSDDERKTIVAKSEGRYAEIDPELQMKLEAKGLSTGQRAGVDLSSVDGFDGLLGPKTEESIEKLLGRDITIPLDDKTLAELNTKLGAATPAVAGKAKAEPASEVAVPEAKATTVLRQRFAKEIDAIEETSTAPTDYLKEQKTLDAVNKKLRLSGSNALTSVPSIMTGTVDEGIKDTVVAKLKKDGIALSQADIDAITVNKGIVYSPLLAKIETALGLSVVDGKLDAQLSAILGITELQKVVADAVKNDSLGQLASIAPNEKAPGGNQKG